MPPNGSTLAGLIQSNINSRMGAIRGYPPLQQKNPHYFVEFCSAVGMGIIAGGPVILYTSTDVGLQGDPFVPGTGSGLGIITDSSFFIEDLYTRIRNYVIQDFGGTAHDPYPPRPGNSGEYLAALCGGIADSFASYYPTVWTLTSVHPQVYMGTGNIEDGQFSGLSAPTIQSDIISGAPDFIGRFWPRLAQAISESYVALIEEHSTGTVTIVGTCIPTGITQICDIMTSAGSGSSGSAS